MGLKSDIRETTDYRKFKKIVQQVQSRLHIDKDLAEAQSLHVGRSSRKLYGNKQYNPKALLDANMNDMAARSRLVEIRVRCSIQIDVLHDACKAMRAFMLTNFSAEIKKRFTTVGDRTAFMDTMIASALEIEREGQSLIAVLDTLIADIDKCSYHLRAVMDALQLLSGSKAGTVI
jgi:hypothetical protein